MNRLANKSSRAALLAAACVAVTMATGCTNALTTAAWLIKGHDVSPDYNGLKEKKVVVVCRTPADLEFSSASAARDLTRELSRLLKTNGKRIDVVPARDVEDWTDENNWDDPREVGKALSAQMIVFVDLEHFSLYKGQTLYQGSADYRVQVIDMEKDGEVVWSKTPPRSMWPPNTAILTSERREPEFRQEFITELATEVSNNFCVHDAYANFGTDARAL